MNKAVFVLIAVALLQSTRAQEKVDFNKSIRPILEKRCVECHTEAKVKGDLRLDMKEHALKAGDGKVITPGKADQSSLIIRVALPPTHDDIMPPKGSPLTREQIELLKRWINDGADWPDGVVLRTETASAAEPATPSSTTSSAAPAGQKAPGQGYASLKPTEDTVREQEAIKKLAALGVSVRPIAQNLQWKEATVRPQDSSKVSEAIALLADIPSLVDLNVSRLNLKDDDVKHLAALTNLQRLHLDNNPITDAAVAHLKALINLEYLNLYNTQASDESIEHLKTLNNLSALYLWQTKVTDSGAETLQAALPSTTINRGEAMKLLVKAEEKQE